MEDYLKRKPENTIQFHYPGQEFTGPGTHIVTKILSGVLPSNKTDFVTMLHDIEYLSKTPPNLSDLRAITNSDNTFAGLITKLGLSARILLDSITNSIKFNTPTNISNVLFDYVGSSEKYKPLFDKYGINLLKYRHNNNERIKSLADFNF